jgi:dolichol-phosphate mannosyltransferase
MILKTQGILYRLWQEKVFRFLICGAITALFNVLLLDTIIRIFEIQTSLLRNIANAGSIEVSLLLSFFVYRTLVWSTRASTIREMILREAPLYHLSCGVSIASRVFIVFPVLDWMGVHYALNTLVGIVLGSIINYKISDKWVFAVKN